MRVEGSPSTFMQKTVELNWRIHKVKILTGSVLFSASIVALLTTSSTWIAGCIAACTGAYVVSRLFVNLTPADFRNHILSMSRQSLLSEENKNAWDRELCAKLEDPKFQSVREPIEEMRRRVQEHYDLGQKFIRKMEAAKSFEDIKAAYRDYQLTLVPSFEGLRPIEPLG